MRIEKPQVLDFIIEQIDPDRVLRPGRVDIDERAPDRKVPGVQHLFDAQVALADKPFAQGPGVEPVACLQQQGPADDEVRRRKPVQQRLGVDDEYFAATRDEVVQGREPLGE